LAFFLIAGSLALGYGPMSNHGFGTETDWVLGFVAALLLFCAVLVHEPRPVDRRHGAVLGTAESSAGQSGRDAHTGQVVAVAEGGATRIAAGVLLAQAVCWNKRLFEAVAVAESPR
jgi:hypothetical protein